MTIEFSQLLQIILFPLFGIIGLMGLYIFKDYQKQVSDDFKDIYEQFQKIDKKFDKVEEADKILSRQEFDEIKSYVKESIDTVINSKEFRDDLKKSISDVILHLEKNRTKGELAMFEHFEYILNKMQREIEVKLENKKN